MPEVSRQGVERGGDCQRFGADVEGELPVQLVSFPYPFELCALGDSYRKGCDSGDRAGIVVLQHEQECEGEEL